MTRIAFITSLLFASACAPEQQGYEEVEEEADWDETELGKADSMVGPMVVVEVGDDFVELRNDGNEPVDLTDYRISFSYRRVLLQPRAGRTSVVAPGALALVIDADTPIPARAMPGIAVVDTSKDIEELLAYSKRLIVRTPELFVTDRADGREPSVPGVTVERRLKTRWVVSAVGGTPGVRNALHDDAFQAHFALPQLDSDNPLPDRLAAWIDEAHASLDAALYQLDHPTVVAALVAAADRGVAVRVVTDSTYLDDPEYAAGYAALRDAGIPVVGDGRTGRQHNKFLVRDGRGVWTGSYNPIVEHGDLFAADNAIAIESRRVADAHTAEFEEMFGGEFGPHKTDGPGHASFVDGALVEVYFSPTDDPKQHILDAIGRADSNIYFSQFSFYEDEFGDAMIERAEAGVDVRGVFDRRSASSVTQYQPMLDAGLDVRRPYYDALLHNKVIIIDYGTADPVVITGSYNLTAKADYDNDESVLIIHDPYVVRAYYEAWRRIYDGCSGPNTDTTGQAPLAISEVFVEPDGAPFVELVNLDGAELDLDGLTLADRDGTALPLSGTVPGGQRVALDVHDLALDHSDPLLVTDAARRTVATFDDPAFPGSGLSMERKDVAAADLDADWGPSALEGGSPGW